MMWKIHDVFILPSFPKYGKQVLPFGLLLHQAPRNPNTFLNDAFTIRTIRSQHPTFHRARTMMYLHFMR
ncbi:hypothetical protein T4E_9890 [Trichinella pseudospiralis]|uniref:Uncharacterized protein n=1 Tax=Trichinella pseudospiralis TaxID=6337 RepID=A0A0V0XDQ4_TRIPS|nr:hypothetical protein T4E_9890 [Trichinella pseudospiralis]